MTKPFKTFSEQVERITNKGIIVEDKILLEKFLAQNNYYRFMKCARVFSQQEQLSANRIMNVYYFDQEIRSWLYSIINDIECYLRTQIAHIVSQTHSSTSYLDEEIFAKGDFERYQREIYRILNKYFKLDENTTEEYLPAFWEVIDYFSYGMLSVFYSDLNTQTSKIISQKTYKVPIIKLRSWIKSSAELRNKIAHYNLLYGQHFETIPADYDKNMLLDSKLFSQIFVLKILYPDLQKWYEKIKTLASIIKKYEQDIVLEHIAFPKDWERKLLQPLEYSK